MTEVTAQLRKNVIEILDLLASEEEQLAYEKNVSHVDITGELLCMWFDDHYAPGSRQFTDGFTAEELAILAEFNAFYDRRTSQLPKSQGTIRTWLANPVWQEIMQEAAKTRHRLPA